MNRYDRPERGAQAYDLLLRLYPRRFRTSYGLELRRVFHQQLRSRRRQGFSVAALWLATLLDFTISVPLAWLHELNRRRFPRSRPFTRGIVSMLISNLLQDVRYALRSFVKQPGLFLILVGTLAIGIGANTAIFSVVNGVLLADLPYESPQGLVRIWEQVPRTGPSFWEVSAGDYLQYRNENETFDALGAYDPWVRFTYVDDDGPVQFLGESVSPNLFDILGAQPQLGRPLVEADANVDRASTIILSHPLWQNYFGGDSDVLGTTIALSDRSYEVVGVMPQGFRTPGLDLSPALRAVVGSDRDFWIPLVISPASALNRDFHYLQVVGRLREDMTREQALADLMTIARRAEAAFPESNGGHTVVAESLREAMLGDVQTPLWIIMGAVGFVLLITCANLANVLLARSLARKREIGVRIALGASTSRLVRQHLVETMALAAVGGALGVVIAVIGTDALMALDTGDLPRGDSVTVNGAVLVFASLVTLVTGVAFGLAPAIFASRTHPLDALALRGDHASPGGVSARHGLLIAQTTLAVVLLVRAGLAMRSFARLVAVPLGFEPGEMLTFRVSLPLARYRDADSRIQYFEALREGVGALPGVERVSVMSNLPLVGVPHGTLVVEDHPVEPGTEPALAFLSVDQHYFETLRIPLFRGSGLTGREDPEGDLVAVISQSMAAQYWPDEDPIGKRFSVGPLPQSWFRVIGIAGDLRQTDLASPPEPMAFFSYPQSAWLSMNVVVRAFSSTAGLASGVRTAVQAVDGQIPVLEMRTFDDIFGAAIARTRFSGVLLTTFALVVAGVGMYGVVAHAVAARTQELGVRMALGATPASVRRLVVRQGMRLAVVGLLGGLALGIAGARLMRGMLFEIGTADPITLAVVPIILLIVSLAASYVPARRATKLDPVAALRA